MMDDEILQQAYQNNHIGTHPSLTLFLVNNSYSVLKCNLPVDDQNEIDEHCEHIHGVAPASLNKEMTTKVYAKIPFKLEPPSILKKTSIIAFFTAGSPTVMLLNTSNKANVDL